MKLSTKRLLFNRYNVFAFVLLLTISFFSWVFFSEYWKAMFVWEPPNHLTREEYLDMLFPFCNYPVEGFSIIQIILPLFSGLIILPFLQDKKSFCYIYPRVKSYRSFLIKKILKQLFVGCTVLFLAYLVFLSIGAAILPMRPDNERELFLEILGENFFKEHMFLFYIVDGFLKYFIFCFVYGLFSASISFLTNKNYLCLIIPLVYFLGLDILCAVLYPVLQIDLFYFSPAYTISSNSRIYTNSFLILAPLLPPLFFSVFTIGWKLREKRLDVYAVA